MVFVTSNSIYCYEYQQTYNKTSDILGAETQFSLCPSEFLAETSVIKIQG